MIIAGRKISTESPPYIVAELSANHNGDLRTALKIIENAKKCGADAVKLQTYTADTITIRSNHEDFQIYGGLWDGKSLYDLYSEAHLPWNWHKPIFEYAKKIGITIFSSPFDSTAVDFLEDLDCPAYKIASFEAIDLPLIRYAAETGKPLIISTGLASVEEIREAVDAARNAGCKDLALLHCVSGYPASAVDYNLHTITDMMKRFDSIIGLSDHTLDNTIAIASVALGALIIEKHFTLDRDGGGPDDSFSMEPSDLESLCRDTRIAWKSLGTVDYDLKSTEKNNLKFRRSLYWMNDLPAESVIKKTDIRSIRPGYGIAPKHIDDVIGRKVKISVSRGSAVCWDDIDIGSQKTIQRVDD